MLDHHFSFIDTPFTSGEVCCLLSVSNQELTLLVEVLKNDGNWSAPEDPSQRIKCYNMWDVVNLWLFSRAICCFDQQESFEFSNEVIDALECFLDTTASEEDELYSEGGLQSALVRSFIQPRWPESARYLLILNAMPALIARAFAVSQQKIVL